MVDDVASSCCLRLPPWIVMTDLDYDELVVPSARRRYALIGLIAAAFLLAVGGVPKILGFGWFASRMIGSEEIFVYVLNTSGQDIEVQLPFAASRNVPAGTIETLRTLDGEITITALDMDGNVLETLDVSADGDLFYNALGSECLAVFDLTGLYGGEGDMEVEARIFKSQHIYQITADTLIMPRRVAPDEARGVVHWIDTVGCNLLEEDNEEYLLAQAQVRLEDRRERREAARRAIREAREQAR